ncbi:hypothetical protein Tco_1477177 [Tanacetum coccineum]
MAENRTMAQLLEAPTEGYEDAIVVPEITANNFEIKHGLLNLVQNKQFFGHDKEDPHAHIRYFNKITSTMKFPNVPRDKDYGTKTGRQSTSSSSAFGQPSSSHLNDDDDDGNEEGTSRISTPSPTRFVNSLKNEVPRVFENPPNIDPDMEPFYTRQTEIINRQV